MQVFDGAKVKENRKRFNLTQYELSAMTKITQARISDIERNVTTVRSEEIISLSKALMCDKDVFYSDKQDVKVIMNTFKKGKKEVNSTKQRRITFPPYSENLEYGTRKPETKQLELFEEKSMIGQDLAGFVLITNDEYKKLIDSKKRLEKFENIFSEVKNG